jgi:hypothetical protein
VELINAVLVAGPLGYLIPGRARSLWLWLGLWAVVFPIQTVVVFHESGDGSDILYWVFNALILAGGIVLNMAGGRLRSRRDARRGATGPTPLVAPVEPRRGLPGR